MRRTSDNVRSIAPRALLGIILVCAELLPSGRAYAQPSAPLVVLPAPKPFRFIDNSTDRQYRQLEGEFERAEDAFQKQSDLARTSIVAAKGEPIGGQLWFRAREEVERAIATRHPARAADDALIEFAKKHENTGATNERKFSLSLRVMVQSAQMGDGDTLVDLLASLSRIPVRQWPP